MRKLLDTEAAYIAAFVDGEGSIGLGRTLRPGCETAYHVNVHVDNTVLSVLKWIRDTTRIGVVVPKERPESVRGRHKQGWTWKLRVEEVAFFLQQIAPFLKIKNAQVELMLEYLNLEKFHLTQTGVPQEVSIQRKLIWEELRDLNKRGISESS